MTIKKLFLAKKIPIIDVTRKSVEETAASIIKILKLKNKDKMIKEVILASSSGIRLKILQDNEFKVKQISPGVDEDEVKVSLINSGAMSSNSKKFGRIES